MRGSVLDERPGQNKLKALEPVNGSEILPIIRSLLPGKRMRVVDNHQSRTTDWHFEEFCDCAIAKIARDSAAIAWHRGRWNK